MYKQSKRACVREREKSACNDSAGLEPSEAPLAYAALGEWGKAATRSRVQSSFRPSTSQRQPLCHCESTEQRQSVGSRHTHIDQLVRAAAHQQQIAVI